MDTDGQQQEREQSATHEKFSVQMQISNEMVRLYKEQFGRGPTKARTNWAGPDTVVAVLGGTPPPAGRDLVKVGGEQRLRRLRRFFPYATGEEGFEPGDG